MNEIEKAIAYFDGYGSSYDDLVLTALHEKAENDRLKAEGRMVVLPEPRLPLVWGDENHDTILCPCCKHDLMGGYLLDHYDHPMYQCPHCGQPIDDTTSISTEDAEKGFAEWLEVGRNEHGKID